MDTGIDTTALFDFDGTITRHDSFPAFLTHLCGGNRLRMLSAMAPYLPSALMAKFGLTDAGKAKERILRRFMSPLSRERLDEAFSSFAQVIEDDVNPEVMARIGFHLNAGHRVCIVSASPAQWIAPWASMHGIDHIIATGLRFGPDGHMDGFSTPNCNGDEKTARIKAFIGSADSRLVVGYGDSSGDYPMLRMCRTAYMVDRHGHISRWHGR